MLNILPVVLHFFSVANCCIKLINKNEINYYVGREKIIHNNDIASIIKECFVLQTIFHRIKLLHMFITDFNVKKFKNVRISRFEKN